MTIYVDKEATAHPDDLPPTPIRELDPRDRRIILVASDLAQEELRRSIAWKKLRQEEPPLASVAAPGVAGAIGAGAAEAAKLYGAWLIGPGGLWLLDWLSRRRGRRVLPYPILAPADARALFQFPLDHPIDGQAYACSEAEPFLYVPLAGFHQYMYQAKQAAFSQLCRHLGAKRCTVLYEEKDGSEITAEVKGSTPVDSLGVKGGHRANASESANVFSEYGPPRQAPRRTDSGWIRGEPSWAEMQEARIQHGIERFRAEFSYASDLGINAEVEGKVKGIGLKTGGTFEAFRKRRWEFEVTFWRMGEEQVQPR